VNTGEFDPFAQIIPRPTRQGHGSMLTAPLVSGLARHHRRR
jgi:hypothetical protein